MDNELLLFDRLNVIKDTINKYGEENFYLSFSGGKDSTILHYLIDMALPNNNIPRVYINTGIEYNDIVAFVKDLASSDDRFEIISPRVPIKQTLEKYGYPFKSKQHSYNLNLYQKHNKIVRSVERYLGLVKSSTFVCPDMLKYQFTKDFKIRCSDLCCKKLKKEVICEWQKANNKNISITGMRADEGGQRSNMNGCIITNSKGSVVKFHPLIKVDENFENWFLEKCNIKLCKLYYPPYNFKRTGCKGCPFALTLQEDLETLEKYLPNERKQCEIIWKPVYEEYRRLNYRLKKVETIKLF